MSGDVHVMDIFVIPDSSCRLTYATGSNHDDGYDPQCNDGACKCVIRKLFVHMQ